MRILSRRRLAICILAVAVCILILLGLEWRRVEKQVQLANAVHAEGGDIFYEIPTLDGRSSLVDHYPSVLDVIRSWVAKKFELYDARRARGVMIAGTPSPTIARLVRELRDLNFVTLTNADINCFVVAMVRSNPRLQTLTLFDCDMSSVDGSCPKLPSVVHLRIVNSSDQSIEAPSQLFRLCHAVRHLAIVGQKLDDELSALRNPHLVEFLSLRRCQLRKQPLSLDQFSNLREFELTSIQCDDELDFSFLNNLDTLTELRVTGELLSNPSLQSALPQAGVLKTLVVLGSPNSNEVKELRQRVPTLNVFTE